MHLLMFPPNPNWKEKKRLCEPVIQNNKTQVYDMMHDIMLFH